MEAILLAGGMGTRLRPVLNELPKPMADIAGRPFITYVLDALAVQGITTITLAVGYKQQSILNFFGEEYRGIKIRYSCEKEPLLTGGALKQALQQCTSDTVLVLNGDTFFVVDLKAMYKFHLKWAEAVTIAVKKLTTFERYGCLEMQGNQVTGFKEKKFCKEGYINGGVYFLQRNALEGIKKDKFSFEKDFLGKCVQTIRIGGFISDGYFIDIGVPEDYRRAQMELKERKNE